LIDRFALLSFKSHRSYVYARIWYYSFFALANVVSGGFVIAHQTEGYLVSDSNTAADGDESAEQLDRFGKKLQIVL
jgi:hypothetical protein